MRSTTHLLLLGLIMTLAITSCVDDRPQIAAPEPVLPATIANYEEPQVSNGFWLNESKYYVTNEGATLGRVLFYDKSLSKNNRVSCGSCHKQNAGFADESAFSRGINDQILTRNTPAIINCYDDIFFFWDGRSETLEDLALRPVRNHREMGLEDPEFLVAKIRARPYYEKLFTAAFGSADVNENRIANALAQFMSSMVSGNSKFDRWNAGEAELTPLEQQGHSLFFGEGRCYQCHSGIDFNDRGGGFGGGFWGMPAANIGLDAEYADQGFGEFNAQQEGEFKIPTLRNIALTAPYMHDGRFETLEEVINHYNKNIQDHPNLSFELQDWSTGGPARLGLSDSDVTALVRFLETLTDASYLADQKFSDPFYN